MLRIPRFLLLLTGGITALFALAACSDDLPTESDRRKTPNFELEDLDGETFRLSDYQGQVVLLEFFAVGCPACQDQTETLNELHHSLADSGLVVAAIPVASGSRENVVDFVEEYEVEYRVLYDERRVVAPAYGVRTPPTTYIIDREGWIAEGLTGATSEEMFRYILRPLLNGSD